MSKQETEDLLFFKDCDRELHRETTDDMIRKHAYELSKERTTKALKMCNYCMYNDKIHRECLATMRMRNEQRLCWKANNIALLIKGGIYGCKTNSKGTTD